MSSVSYALRQVKYSLPIETLKLIYNAHVHSIISHGLIFWAIYQVPKKYSNYKRKLSELFQIPGEGILAKKFSRTCK
jgi:hypothetical protein